MPTVNFTTTTKAALHCIVSLDSTTDWFCAYYFGQTINYSSTRKPWDSEEQTTTDKRRRHSQHYTMDYQGQRLAELIFYWIILSFGGVGWIIGYFRQDFMVVFQFWLVGVAISVVVRVKNQTTSSILGMWPVAAPSSFRCISHLSIILPNFPSAMCSRLAILQQKSSQVAWICTR